MPIRAVITSIQLQNKNCKKVLQDHQKTSENAGPHKALVAKIVKGHRQAYVSPIAVNGILNIGMILPNRYPKPNF